MYDKDINVDCWDPVWKKFTKELSLVNRIKISER